MLGIPDIPAWNAIHPSLVHLPLGTLFAVAVLLIIGLIRGDKGVGYNKAAFVLMIVGTIGVFLAVMSGQAGEGAARNYMMAQDTLHEHEEMGELVRFIFLGLTFAMGVLLAVPAFRGRKLGKRARIASGGGFLLLYLVGCLALANTAHEGGELVHKFGVHAPIE